MDPKQSCPCCKHVTIQRKYDVCPVCFWEHDPLQEQDVKSELGSNRVSLSQARKNYIEFGACERRYINKVRKPIEGE